MLEFAALRTDLAWRKRGRQDYFSRRDRLATKAISAARPPM